MTATGKRFAAVWMHAAHLLVDGRKMSKSAGNEYTLDDIGARPPPGGKTYSPADFRYYCLTLHYSSPMNFTWDGQERAARARSRLQAAFRRAALRGTSGENVAAALRAEFLDAISDDLNMPRARRGPQGGPGGNRGRRGPVARGGVGQGPCGRVALRSRRRTHPSRRKRGRTGWDPRRRLGAGAGTRRASGGGATMRGPMSSASGSGRPAMTFSDQGAGPGRLRKR